MTTKYKSLTQFDVIRRRAYARAKCQADFRFEDWNLKWTDFCKFWPSEEIWALRGTKAHCICLTRRDHTKPWDAKNCCLMNRGDILAINNRSKHGLPVDHIWVRARFLKDL